MINQVKYKSALKRQIKRLLKREIRYISSFFTYDIKRFHNQDLLYLQGFLLTGVPFKAGKDNGFNNRLINLITGLELLSIGTAFHGFKKSGSNVASESSIPAIEKNYTLDLLFGDIFYSRAVMYLLKYRDHNTFDSILGALKKLHESRLKLHIKIQKVIRKKHKVASLAASPELLIDANRLLYVAIEIGKGLSGGNRESPEPDSSCAVRDQVLIYKIYDELLEYVDTFSKTSSIKKIRSGLLQKKKILRQKLGNLKAGPYKTSFTDSISQILSSLDRD